MAKHDDMLPVRAIRLANGRGHAIVDPEDYELVRGRRWRNNRGRKTSYAIAGRSPDHVLMHQLIANSQNVDHLNHDGLDNRRDNLRDASESQNMANRGKFQTSKGTTSDFKGVSLIRQGALNPWKAKITVDHVQMHLGCFATEVEAAEAYDVAALNHYGEHALTNEMLGLL